MKQTSYLKSDHSPHTHNPIPVCGFISIQPQFIVWSKQGSWVRVEEGGLPRSRRSATVWWMKRGNKNGWWSDKIGRSGSQSRAPYIRLRREKSRFIYYFIIYLDNTNQQLYFIKPLYPPTHAATVEYFLTLLIGNSFELFFIWYINTKHRI